MQSLARAGCSSGCLTLCRTIVLAFAFIATLASAGAAPVQPVRDYTTAELMRGFLLTVFGREGPASGRQAGQYVNKFIDPVGVYVLDAGSVPGREAEVDGFVKLLGRTVPNLKIRIADDPAGARLFVFIVDRSNYRRVIADALPDDEEARFLARNRCSSIMWNRTTGVLDRAYIFILADKGDAAFTSCLAEELTQALGPANDNDSLKDSLYNDSNDVGVFGLFDWYILSALYDRAMLPGMTAAEAQAALPAAIARLRPKAAAVAPLLAPLPAGPQRR